MQWHSMGYNHTISCHVYKYHSESLLCYFPSKIFPLLRLQITYVTYISKYRRILPCFILPTSTSSRILCIRFHGHLRQSTTILRYFARPSTLLTAPSLSILEYLVLLMRRCDEVLDDRVRWILSMSTRQHEASHSNRIPSQVRLHDPGSVLAIRRASTCA